MPKDFKKPKINQGKKLKVSNEQLVSDSTIDYPIFCFKHLHSEYGIANCSDEQLATFLKKIYKLSTMTWNQIKLSHRHGLGAEKIKKSSIKVGVPSFITEDVDHFLAFRCFGLMPFLAHRNGSLLHVIYIDPEGKVYDHGS